MKTGILDLIIRLRVVVVQLAISSSISERPCSKVRMDWALVAVCQDRGENEALVGRVGPARMRARGVDGTDKP